MARVAAVERVAWHVWAMFVVGVAAAAFVAPAYTATGGVWPAPLDDTYIYYGCARSFALGEPFAWYPGNGYGSGCTSTLYPLLLAPMWGVGLRGSWLGVGTALVAVACLFDLCRSLRRLCGEHPVSWLFPLMVVAVPLLDWSLWSGMETALLAAVVGRALCAVRDACEAGPEMRPFRQTRAGLWLAALSLTRPEMVPLIGALAVTIAYRGGAIPLRWSFARGAGPAVAVLSLQAFANRLLTGEWTQAGAVRKALWSSPFVDDSDIALAWLQNLVVLVDQAIVRGLGGTVAALALPLLCIAAIASAKHRLLATAGMAGAVGALLLVCVNSTARYQNYRYAAPTLVLLIVVAALGVHALAAWRPWRGSTTTASPVGAVLAAIGILAPARQAELQIDHFARASANIVEQHGAVAARVRELAPRRILVNDAGAIPYLAEVRPIDGFGLGGFRGLPFARASVHGHPAVVELIERLDPGDRPDLMALYPNWWGDVLRRFGHPIARVRIEDNVICGHHEKVIASADWRQLAGPGETVRNAVDTLDVADLISEREHALRFPAPQGGWVVGHARYDGRAKRYDAARIVPAERALSFVVASDVSDGPATLRIRSHRGATVKLAVWRGGTRVAEGLAVAAPGATSRAGVRWMRLHGKLDDVGGGDRIELVSEHAWEPATIWLLRP